jgi:hypothetical protein
VHPRDTHATEGLATLIHEHVSRLGTVALYRKWPAGGKNQSFATIDNMPRKFATDFKKGGMTPFC